MEILLARERERNNGSSLTGGSGGSGSSVFQLGDVLTKLADHITLEIKNLQAQDTSEADKIRRRKVMAALR